MTQVELPSNDGKIIGVNPHHVTSCREYMGYLTGIEGKTRMTVVSVRNHDVYICAWPIEQTLDVLNAAKHGEAAAFAAGWRARHACEDVDATVPRLLEIAFKEWLALEPEERNK